LWRPDELENAIGAGHILGMTDACADYGWMVRVLSRLDGRSRPTEQWFAVGDPDEIGAERVVRAHPGIEEKAFVKAHRQLVAPTEIKNLRLKPGEVRHFV
jgi:hypothetical protein